ncbi:MAG TPA: hypothetical protein VF629_17380 [Hymenobacter sp.]|jgi:hypothetical protein|uniref:hypothetical protein n=1 Tax=Hymenobacter sp. TaxID=1898978 RepID=UPI002ED8736D
MRYPFTTVGLAPPDALVTLAAVPALLEVPAPAPTTLADELCPNAVVAPTVRRLAAVLEQMRQQEMKQFQHKKMGSAEASLLEEATKGVLTRFLELVAFKFDQACHRGDDEPFAKMLTAVFRLESEPAHRPQD